MFIVITSFLLCSAISAERTGREEVVYPTLDTLRSGIKTVKFTALDQNINLSLESASDIIADDFAVYDGNGNKLNSSAKNLKAKIYRDSKNGAALIIDEDGPISIKGIVNSNLRIEPIESVEKIKDGIKAHRIIELKPDERPVAYFNDAIIPSDFKDEEAEVKDENDSKSES